VLPWWYFCQERKPVMLNFRKWWSKKSNPGYAALPLRLEILEDRYLLSGTGTISGSLSGNLNSPICFDGTLTGGLTGIFDATGAIIGEAGGYIQGQIGAHGNIGSNIFIPQPGEMNTYSINVGSENTFTGNFIFSDLSSDQEYVSGSGTVSGTYDPSTYDVVSSTFIGILNENGILLTNPGTQNNNEGDSVTLPISASDPTGTTLTYAATGLPAGLLINPNTGVITGTVSVGAAASSPNTTTITASNGAYTAQQSFTWNVASPITLVNPGTQTSVEGTSPTLDLSATDSTGGTLSFAASGLPNGLNINTNTGAITGTVAPGGPYSVTVTAQDGTCSTNQMFTWNINSRRHDMEILPAEATTLGRWVDAGHLRVGDELLLRDGRVVPVETLRVERLNEEVYNFELEAVHTYAVGQNEVLVHNGNAKLTPIQAEASAVARELQETKALLAEQQAIRAELEADPGAQSWEIVAQDRIITKLQNQISILRSILDVLGF
jgi:hypothetical protein